MEPRIEFLTTEKSKRGKHRQWSIDLKARIVSESLRPSVTVQQVVDRYGVRANYLSSWRTLVDALHVWLQSERSKLSRSSPVAEPIDYMLKRWNGFITFLDDGRICLTNNAAERALRGFALGRKAWHFAGSGRGADRAACIVTLINTAKLNDVDPQAWLVDVLGRIDDTPITKLEQLLPWNWTAQLVNEKTSKIA